MGNEQKDSKAIINVILDNSVYLPGENISGNIEILFKEQIETNKLQNPKIEFSILQHKYWESSFSSQNDKLLLKSELNNCFYEISKDFTKKDDKNIFSGFKFKFIFMIPKDILPSLEWPNKKGEFAFIRNYFYVQIPELSIEKQVLIIIQKYPDKVQRILKVANEEDKKKYPGKNGGITRVEASYPQYSYPALGNIPLTVLVNSSGSDTKIKEVIIKLKRLLEFKSKNSEKVDKRILQVMYSETRKIKEKTENILFNIPFKDGKEIDFCFSKSMYRTKDEISCILPNVNTNIIKVSYYIKIIAIPSGLFNKNIELKLNVDFHSKGENNLNEKVFDNFGKTIVKINNGKIPLDKEGIYSSIKFDNNNDIDLNKNAVFFKKTKNKIFLKRSITPDSYENNRNNMKFNNLNNNNINMNFNMNNNMQNNFNAPNSMNNMNNMNMNNMNLNNMNINNMNNLNINMNNISNMNNITNMNNFNMNNFNMNINNINNMNNMNNIGNMNINNINNMNNIGNMNNMNKNNLNLNNMNNINMNNFGNINSPFSQFNNCTLPSLTEVEQGHNLYYMNKNKNNNNDNTKLNYPGF